MIPDRNSLPTVSDVSLTFTAIKFSWRNHIRAGLEGDRFDFLVLERLTVLPPDTVQAWCEIGPTIGRASRWTLFTLVITVRGQDAIKAYDVVLENPADASDEAIDSLHTEMFNILAATLERAAN